MLRLLEGFDHYGDSGRTGTSLDTDLQRRHEGTRIIYGTPDGDLIAGRGGHGLGLRIQDADANNKIWLTRFDASQSDTWIVGFAMKTAPFTTGLITVFASSDSAQISLYLIEGCLMACGTSWPDPEACNKVLKPNRWYYIEIKMYHHNTAGTIEVHIDGTAVYSTTGRDTQHADYTPGSFMLGGVDNNIAFDDIYVCDDTGSDNNDFLGPIKVETLRPNGDDGSQNWSPSSGANHYELVNSSNLWQVTDYVEANGANVDDIWTYPNLSKINATIHGVQAIASAWSDSSMPRPLQHICVSGNTYYSATRGLGIEKDYPMPHDDAVWENDPDTANAWTANGINSASFGIRKVA